MGQSQSQQNQQANPKRTRDFYSNYIQQQQLLIQQQQLQINNLYKMNVNSQTTANMMFQSQQPHEQVKPQKALPSSRQKLDPYKILQLPKQFDLQLLKKAYLKAAMKHHPDRGGSESEFQKISIAYAILQKKLNESNNSHDHNELRGQSRDYRQTQEMNPGQNIHMRDEFNVDLFNKIYSENRINDVYDEGYDSWMKESQNKISQPKMFQGNFNKDLFNSEFEKHKYEMNKQNGSQVVKYKEPEVKISLKNQDSLMVLGQDKISNFSGDTGNLSYRDYRDAFTNSNLIDVSQIDISKRSSSMKTIEKDRSQLSYQLSPQDQQRQAIQQQQAELAETRRLQRLQVYDQQGEDMYNRVHQMLLRD